MTGIRRTKFGWQAYLEVHGRTYSKRFPPETDPDVMQAWRKKRRAIAEHGLTDPSASPASTTFRDDARRYLDAVSAMPTYNQREQHILLWVQVFGHRPRASITAAEIRAELQRWRLKAPVLPRKRKRRGRPRARFGPATCNKVRTALQHLYTVLDGKSQPNIVKDVPKFREPDAEPRALPYPVVRAILDAMPPSRSRAICQVMAYFGIPPSSQQRMKIDWTQGVIWIPGREKGKGTRPRVLPIPPHPQARAALKEWEREDGMKGVNWAPLALSFRRAKTKVEDRLKMALPGVTAYWLRHSFGTAMYRATKDLRAAQEALGHATPSQTLRYTLNAVPEHLEAATAAFWEQLPKARRAK